MPAIIVAGGLGYRGTRVQHNPVHGFGRGGIQDPRRSSLENGDLIRKTRQPWKRAW